MLFFSTYANIYATEITGDEKKMWYILKMMFPHTYNIKRNPIATVLYY